MGNQSNGNAVQRAIASQVRQLQGVTVSESAIDSLLSAMSAGAVAAVPGARHAGITVVDGGTVVSVAPTDEIAARLAELQAKHDIGPCLDAAWKQRVIRIDDHATEDRWQDYVTDVVVQTPVRASVSFPVHRDADTMSSMVLHSDHPNAFDGAAVETGRTFAALAALALQSDSRLSQFNDALASRDLIGQAKGILMERYDVDSQRAFAMLREISQETNIKIAELARRLVTIDHPSTAA